MEFLGSIVERISTDSFEWSIPHAVHGRIGSTLWFNYFSHLGFFFFVFFIKQEDSKSKAPHSRLKDFNITLLLLRASTFYWNGHL